MPFIDQQEALDALNTQAEEMSHWHERYAEQRKGILTAIRIVSDIKPKQANCEYCHTDRDGYVFPLEKNSHAFIDRDKIVLKANGWRGEAKIKYCPICGRRLTDAVD